MNSKKETILITTPEEEIAKNGFYLFKSKTGSIFKKLLLILDLFVFGILYLLVGLGLSYSLNRFTTSKLDTNQTKTKLFGEIILEILFTVIGLYIAILILGNIPDIAKDPPVVHKIIRAWESSVILIFTIIVLQTKLTEKILYVFGES